LSYQFLPLFHQSLAFIIPTSWQHKRQNVFVERLTRQILIILKGTNCKANKYHEGIRDIC
jgi:hypothetical protein